jgi:PAS domain S-box-containing protein
LSSKLSSPGTQRLRLLVVEHSEDVYESLVAELRAAGYALVARRVATAAELEAALAEPWDLVATDWTLTGFSGQAALELVAARAAFTPSIVIASAQNEDAAINALGAGALYFLSKDRPRIFVAAIDRALREAAERRARVEAERELRLSEERYRLGFIVAPEALLTYDLDHARILDANPAALRLFGYSLDEMRAAEPGELSPPAQPDGRPSPEAARTVVARSAGQHAIVFDWTFRAKDGSPIPAEVRHVQLPSSLGVKLARATIIDLRERNRIDEMRRRSIELEVQNRRIVEANRLKTEFLANMSHELRTPLNAVIGFAELLHDGAVDPASLEHREFLGDILASGRHLLQLINDVLDLAKVEAGKLDFRPEPVDVGKLLGEVVTITRATAAAKQIVVTTAIEPGVDKLVLDPNRFKQIAYNYLSNALKFTPERGRVELRVTAESEASFRLEVEDTGIGIDASDLGRLFIEFHQLEAGASKRHQGTGLGLALTRRLVEAQGGTVGVRSVRGEGSVFHAVLPRVARRIDAVSPTAIAPPRLGPRSVLVVEDDERDALAIAAQLGEAGYACEVVRTGSEALARCRSRTFDAVTLDLLLPDMDGLDVLTLLRAEGHVRTAPVIVVSVVPDAKLIAGFTVHDVLRKPLERGELQRALERAGVRPDRAGGILVVDDDASALKLMDVTLAQLGYSAITRSSGKAALDAAEQLGPSAVVLDLMMPEMDGVEFLDRFRSLPAHARTPVLIWTMKDLSVMEHAQLRESAQAIVSKNGHSPSTVVAQLRALLETGGS